jgi:hypothetical protein
MMRTRQTYDITHSMFVCKSNRTSGNAWQRAAERAGLLTTNRVAGKTNIFVLPWANNVPCCFSKGVPCVCAVYEREQEWVYTADALICITALCNGFHDDGCRDVYDTFVSFYSKERVGSMPIFVFDYMENAWFQMRAGDCGQIVSHRCARPVLKGIRMVACVADLHITTYARSEMFTLFSELMKEWPSDTHSTR